MNAYDPETDTCEQRPARSYGRHLWTMFAALTFFMLGWCITAMPEVFTLPEKFRELDSALLRDVMGFDAANPLLFNTGLFLILFTLFIGIYQAASRRRMLKSLVVISFSLYFYWKSSASYCFILLGVCLADFVIGGVMEVTTSRLRRRLLVALNVALNVGMLVYFKYFNLLFDTFASITGTHFDPLDIILPAGISFFSFRSISYVVDVYRGTIKACDNLLDYIFFLTFFPPLLAGPVVRAADMLPQIKSNPTATRGMVSEGIFLIICGLVKKVIVADYLSGNFVDRIFDNPALYSGFENLMGVAGFTLQIYCDFSGYSDMAIGLALLMGFRFKANFDAPFKSQNPTEFWRRWHISLSSWLKDYIYIPLGGSRKGRGRRYGNLTITMLVGGLWHGASWMYLLWGGYNALLLAGHKALNGTRHPLVAGMPPRRRAALNILLTMILVAVGMMIFRAPSLTHLGTMCSQIFTDFRPGVIPSFIASYITITVLIVGGFIMHYLPRRLTDRLLGRFSAMPLLAQAVILAIAIFIIIQTRQADIVPFVYLQY